MKNKVSPEVEAQSMKMAKGTQKIGQTKEQTKLVAQGIEKGIAEYKKQQGKKLREIDKQRKQKIKLRELDNTETQEEAPSHYPMHYLPWVLLGLSWLGFSAYIVL
jgi:predicted PilT family ATPase